ncbi:MAG TPA: hypothetical protein VIX19_06735 [Terriglobales bacterium]
MKRARIALALCFAILALTAWSLAQDSKSNADGPITGTWQCAAHGGSNGDTPFTLYLTQNKDVVTGSVSSPLGDTELSSATFTNNTLEIHINTDGGNYVLTAKLENGQLSGDWSMEGGDKGKWDGKKSTDAPQAKQSK